MGGLFKQLGPIELLIILAIVLLVFGVGRLSRLGKDLGEGITAFRRGLKSGSEDEEEKEVEVVEEEES